MNIEAQSKVIVSKIERVKLPFGVKYEGEFKSALHWTDKLGENIAIISETGVFNKKSENDDREGHLYGYNYLVKGSDITQTWKVTDGVGDCVFDVEAEFFLDAFQVTDLNNDGIGEVWLMYKVACHSDVSPCEMKIIMYQGHNKYAMRGRNMVKISETESEGGEYTFDSKFLETNTVFRDFAKALWAKNIWQVW